MKSKIEEEKEEAKVSEDKDMEEDEKNGLKPI